MERLTTEYTRWNCANGHKLFFDMNKIADRLAAIEDILGDEYDLDRLRELAEADREGRLEIIEPDVAECVKIVKKAQAALRREQE